MEGDDRTFGVNYSTEGVAKLREAVTEKLKEFMGDYTDDTLVEYVIVLLKNGRRKDEAKNELDVFLGDDSLAFVTWLWDHLGSNLSLYVEQDLHQLVEPITKSTVKQGVENEVYPIELKGTKETSDTAFGHNDKMQQKGPVRDLDGNEVSLPHNSVVDNVRDEFQQKHGRSNPSDSHRQTSQKKRRHSGEKRPSKTEVIESTVSASRRLLQFAVRDAVAKSHPSKSTSERSLKRLRSVISTSTRDPSLEERPRRMPRTSMSAAIKAVAEAAEDVRKVRSTRSVFDRLGRGTNISDAIDHHQEEFGGVAEDLGDEDFYVQQDTLPSTYNPQNSSRLPHEAVPSIHDVMMPSDLGYDGEAYDGMYIREQEANEIDGFGTSGGNLVEKSQSYHRGAAVENANGRLSRAHKGSRQPATDVPKASLRIDSSLDMATKKSQYREEKEVREIQGEKFLLGSDATANKSKEWSMERRISTVTVNGNARSDPIPQQSQATQTTIGLANVAPPMEDADSRTIFASNVHFAATKDSLSRHFNKFGEVSKVITLTDPTTGLPKGSAYIEFTRKEAAELALSLDGTSFMSRILKIVKKSSTPSETASGTPRPSIPRSSSFPVPKFGRAHFPRAVYRGRGVSLRPGTRSFQWKRDAEPTTVTSNQAASNIVTPPPPNRSMTYVRSEPKTSGSTDNA